MPTVQPDSSSLRPIYICGSTATGKTGISIALANHINGEIVNADAYQVYRGLDTITAAPSPDELTQAPHHLFGTLDPTEDFDAQRYLDLATPIISDIQSRGKTPIIVGGSGMYLKFLTHGPSPLPPGNDQLRAELDALPEQDLITQLQTLDPTGAAQTNLKNRRYVTRALEICLLTRQPMSKLKTDWEKSTTETEKHLRGILLDWDREELRQRIATRTQLMIESGAIQEVAAHPHLSKTCEKAIGIRDIQSHLRGEISLERCQELIFFATCQYAKRQRTWFNREPWITKIPMHKNLPPAQILKHHLHSLSLK
ncbi:MAG: tRNA (adenosine(37)-N6)-dimethylallyltransferase MiaA [Akkermansiaceae bacterium]